MQRTIVGRKLKHNDCEHEGAKEANYAEGVKPVGEYRESWVDLYSTWWCMALGKFKREGATRAFHFTR